MSIPKELANANAQRYLDAAAPECAQILIDHGKGKRKRLQASRQRACEYVIDHAIGKSKQKTEHSGGIQFYGALVKSAEEQEKNSPELLIDVDKMARN